MELKEPKAYDPKWAKWSLDSLPILPGRYEFQVAKGKSKQFKIVKRLLKGTDTVINGCVLLGAKAIFTLDFLNGIVENKKILANIEIQIISLVDLRQYLGHK